MDSDFLILHKNHIENYFESFWNTFDKIDDLERKKNYLEWKIQIEEKRLNRYLSENGLNPEKYIDHQLIVSDIQNIINKLDYIKNQLFITIKPILLNYGIKNETIIQLLHEKLYSKYISIDFEEFILHFNNTTPLLPIKWLGTESLLVNLFSSLKLVDYEIHEILSKHFINKNGNPFKQEQLSVTKSKTTLAKFHGKEYVDQILNQIQKITEKS